MMGNLPFKKLSALTLMFSASWISNSAMAAGRDDSGIYASATYISGSLAGARNAESLQFFDISDGGSWMYIYASTDAGYGGCFTVDTAIMAQVRTANSDTRLSMDISEGTCTNVLLHHSSLYAPKNH